MKRCKIYDCNSEIFGRGYCNQHYKRIWRHGSPYIVKLKKTFHGFAAHSLYSVWRSMKARCYNSNNKVYKNYGGKGITVFDEWKNNPILFIRWNLSNGWERGLCIDRINNEGNYHPSNCQFITRLKSNHNKRLLQTNNKSGYRGVSKNKDGKWAANIRYNNKSYYLGCFNSAKLAAIRWDVENYILGTGYPTNFIDNFSYVQHKFAL